MADETPDGAPKPHPRGPVVEALLLDLAAVRPTVEPPLTRARSLALLDGVAWGLLAGLPGVEA